MKIKGKPVIELSSDAQNFINLYQSLGERAENFVPADILDKLNVFVRMCYEEHPEPTRQNLEINRLVLELKEAIPDYTDVELMLSPHQNSKAFQFRQKKQEFTDKLNQYLNNETVYGSVKEEVKNILNLSDYSIGTPPVTKHDLDLLYQTLTGDRIEIVNRFREVLGITNDLDEIRWNFLLDVMNQMIIQSTHYTTTAELNDFFEKVSNSVKFKGLNGFIPTVVSGSADMAIKLLSEEVFRLPAVRVIEFENQELLYKQLATDTTGIFLIKCKGFTQTWFNDKKWFKYLSRIVIIDNSTEAAASNISLVYSFHNGIINTLNKVHNKKLGVPANSQLNLRLILDRIDRSFLDKLKNKLNEKIASYEVELKEFKSRQLGETQNADKDIVLFRFDEFSQQIIKDKYVLMKLRDYVQLIINTTTSNSAEKQNKELVHEYEERVRNYFYSDNNDIKILTINEGGGRNQIRSYGEYLLQRNLKSIPAEITKKCRTILNIIPNTYERTLKNHFHKNFGINLFLEKYKEHITKAENNSDNKGRFNNFLIDLGVKEKYEQGNENEKNIINAFLRDLGNLNKTSISDDVQMIVRDILVHKQSKLRPYILYAADAAWEYQDLLPPDRFDINPFDLEIGFTNEGRLDYNRLVNRLQRMKNTFQLFDDSSSLWDLFCENLTIIINDPSNPSGYSDFNSNELISFIKFVSNSKITLFLDEAYNDGVKKTDEEKPKWRSISRYIMNNFESNYSNIRMVTSLSTTKNLYAAGNRLGALACTPALSDLVPFIRAKNTTKQVNTNSLYMIVNMLETAQLAKKLKDQMENRLSKNASVYGFRKRIIKSIKNEIESYQQRVKNQSKNTNNISRFTPFEGSPLHIFLLNQLIELDKLEVLSLPDDFMYKGQPFFKYYQLQLSSALNKFRANKNFQKNSMFRLSIAKNIANKIINNRYKNYAEIINSDGSYLFNLRFKNIPSYQGLEKFTKTLAEQRGISAIPYKTGFIRMSLGGYLEGSQQSIDKFTAELENVFNLLLKYWKLYYDARTTDSSKQSEDILKEIFKNDTDKEFIKELLNDFNVVKNIVKNKISSLLINSSMTIYQAFPQESGVSINSIEESQNAVFEFHESIGQCKNLIEFMNSKAFTKIYENLLPQVIKRIPALSNYAFSDIASRYGKTTLIKFIHNKLNYQPNNYILDEPNEYFIMTEILIEMEDILFSDAKFKILALNETNNSYSDQTRLEGTNSILRKYIRELLVHFNLPFENQGQLPDYRELFYEAIARFEEISGIKANEINPDIYFNELIERAFEQESVKNTILAKLSGKFKHKLYCHFNENHTINEKLLFIHIARHKDTLKDLLIKTIQPIQNQFDKLEDNDAKLFVNKYIEDYFDHLVLNIINTIDNHTFKRIKATDVAYESRAASLFILKMVNITNNTEYYHRFSHILYRLTEIRFKRQKSAINEMIQHGITLFKDLDLKDSELNNFDNGRLKWINDILLKTGLIAAEQTVQTHTRIVTDAKKREYPFFRIDSSGKSELNDPNDSSPNAYIKRLDVKPTADFFEKRMSEFIKNMDKGDYRCKIVKTGLFNELVIFQKSYIKYLADNYRLLGYNEIKKDDLKSFVPDVILFMGAPEKVISFPKIGYFDIKGPSGSIKTLVTPLEKKVDYFGDIKKPRLTMINEKVKEMGGLPIHGSLFAIEETDGSVFVVQVAGDSGVGKSEMLAALMLKWLRNDLNRIRSIKLVAGDMFHIFTDKNGYLYGIGTEVGDFSRVTDFDPDYIQYYHSLFESSADSNVEDLNSRSTIGGLCDITIPYKIDIMLTASNYAREEAGVIRYDNPENFLLYRDSHGERKEKATSSDHPSLQRTLMRYTADKEIVSVLDKHGNYLDELFDWLLDKNTGVHYLGSSYRMIDKIDPEEIIRAIFNNKSLIINSNNAIIKDVQFNIIKNRFKAICKYSNDQTKEHYIDKHFFNLLFNALASTPAGQPFIAEEGQNEGRKALLNILKENYEQNSDAKVHLGVLSTDLGKKGREISGPQKAAEDLKTLIQEVRLEKPEINKNKLLVKNLVRKSYARLFANNGASPEIDRYNFYLWQLHKMRQAEFVRIEDKNKTIDMQKFSAFNLINKNISFEPLLVTPNINTELNGYSETYKQLIDLPNVSEFSDEFSRSINTLYDVQIYNKETRINNLIIQLLILHKFISIHDLNSGRITEKVNRETIAAAKHAVVNYIEEVKDKVEDKKKDIEKQ